MNQVLIGFGANLGDPVVAFGSALGDLLMNRVLFSANPSSIFSTAPVGGPSHQPNYRNAVVAAKTPCGPRELMVRLLEVERQYGRDREHEVRWGPRLLDLDLIAFGEVCCLVPGLELPHPRAPDRPFVLGPAGTLPLNEIPKAIRDFVRSFPASWPKEQMEQEIFPC